MAAARGAQTNLARRTIGVLQQGKQSHSDAQFVPVRFPKKNNAQCAEELALLRRADRPRDNQLLCAVRFFETVLQQVRFQARNS